MMKENNLFPQLSHKENETLIELIPEKIINKYKDFLATPEEQSQQTYVLHYLYNMCLNSLIFEMLVKLNGYKVFHFGIDIIKKNQKEDIKQKAKSANLYLFSYSRKGIESYLEVEVLIPQSYKNYFETEWKEKIAPFVSYNLPYTFPKSNSKIQNNYVWAEEHLITTIKKIIGQGLFAKVIHVQIKLNLAQYDSLGVWRTQEYHNNVLQGLKSKMKYRDAFIAFNLQSYVFVFALSDLFIDSNINSAISIESEIVRLRRHEMNYKIYDMSVTSSTVDMIQLTKKLKIDI